jgi:aldehyde dehydrogenase (NAD+)
VTLTASDKPLVEFLGGGPKHLLIGGKWVPARSGQTFDTYNPSTGEVIAKVAAGDRDDVDAAVAAARNAFEGPWSRFTPVQRQNVLLKLADLVERHLEELSLIDVVDMGRPIGGEIHRSLEMFLVEVLRYYAGWTTKIEGHTVANSLPGSFFSYTLKSPIGVVGSIIPWNGPVMSAILKLAPVLATGCTTVLKPAEEASLGPLRLGELIQELDLPSGVINVVTGFGETAGAALSHHPGVDKLAFTGSTATGQELVRAAAGNLKRLQLELGGKSADVIFADADLDIAAPSAAMAVFANSGQVCVAGTRVFVQRPVYEEVVSRISAVAGSLRVGNSLDPDTQIGPLVSQAQLERVSGYLAIGKAEGARTTAGGDRLVDADLAKGYFVAPTVFADVQDDMRIAKEEIFGPVASILPFDTVEEVAHRANITQYGLGGGLWTRDLGTAHRLANAMKTGTVWVNTYGVLDPAMPFGGAKMSGWGKELSAQSLDGYLDTKSIFIRTDI